MNGREIGRGVALFLLMSSPFVAVVGIGQGLAGKAMTPVTLIAAIVLFVVVGLVFIGRSASKNR